MELEQAVRARHMVRAFADRPLAASLIDGLCDLARRAPSAGNTQATSFLVLDHPAAVTRYWDASLGAARRSSFRWPGLLVAPALILVVVEPAAYVTRYREPDKAATGRGEGEHRWPVPYWWVDAGAAAEHLLLGAVAAGLGACLFGAFDHERAIAEAFEVPEGQRLAATIAVGHPVADEPGRSAGRPRPPLQKVVHRNRW